MSISHKRIRIGIVGLNFGRHIVEEITIGHAKSLFELVAVCDFDAAKAASVAAAAGAQVYSDLGQMLADPAIDAIGLFTGPGGRAKLVQRIVAAGKPVITTKPFETDPVAALAVLREARALGVPVHLNSPGPLASADLVRIEQWREAHSLGRPVGARADVWVRYHEKPDGTWYDDPQMCQAAPLVRLGIYLINDLVRILGPAQEVFVQHSRLFTERPTADNSQASIKFENGALANCFASFCVDDGDYYRNGLTLNFERGTIYRNNGPVRPDAAIGACEMSLVMMRDGMRAVVERAEIGAMSGGYQWETFARAVRGEIIEGEITPEQIASALRVLQGLSRSALDGTVVVVGG